MVLQFPVANGGRSVSYVAIKCAQNGKRGCAKEDGMRWGRTRILMLDGWME